MNYLTKSDQDSWRVQNLTRPPEKPYYIAPEGIDSSNAHTVDIVNEKAVINATRLFAWQAQVQSEIDQEQSLKDANNLELSQVKLLNVDAILDGTIDKAKLKKILKFLLKRAGV